MTGADREWAARYKPGDILKYEKGSKAHGIARNSTAVVLSADARNNTVTVQQDGGKAITYDPKRLKGVNAYRETDKEFATGDRIQFTAKRQGFRCQQPRSRHHHQARNRTDHRSDGRQDRAHRPVRPGQDEALRPRLCRHVPRLARAHRRPRYCEHRHGFGPFSHQHPARLRRGFACGTRREDLHQRCGRPWSTAGNRRKQNLSRGLSQVSRPAPQKNTVVQVREYADPNHRIAAVALAYAEHPSNTVVIAQDPAERRELNQLIRADLQASGTVAPDSKSLPVYIEKELTNPKLAAQYAPGDIIQYRQGSPASQGIPSGSAAVVVATDTRNNQLTVSTSHGDEVIYSPHLTTAMTAQSKVYREEQQEFAQGDRVRMTEASATQGIRKGDFGTITSIGDTLEVRLDKGESVQLTKERAKHIEHGYAVDSLRTGAPDRVLISQDGSFQAPSGAASLSRTGREVSIYTSDVSAQANAVAPAIALPDQLKPAIALPVQQQSEAPSNAIAPEQAPVIQHRHSRGR